MRVDHLSYACGPEGLQATSERLSEVLAVESVDGGFHARFGTRNRTIPLAEGRYLEIVEVLDHPAAEKAPFGQVVRTRSEQGGGWLGWVIALSAGELPAFERRLGRDAVDGSRRLPDGTTLEWKQLGVRGTMSDPQLPFFVEWISDDEQHPGHRGSPTALRGLDLAGQPQRVAEWLGEPTEELSADVAITWVTPAGQPGIASAQFDTARGPVRI